MKDFRFWEDLYFILFNKKMGWGETIATFTTF